MHVPSFCERLARGEILVGCNVRHSRTAEIGAILADCGFAWIMLDNEHSPVPTGAGYDMALGALRAGVTPFARVRRNEPAEIASCLTNGTLGVLVPHVNRPEEAARAARATRFPPRGELSVPGSIPQFGYRHSLAEAAALFNAQAVTAVMIESRVALDNVEEIAATPGVDVLFIGASDLIYDLGLPGGYGSPLMADAVRRTVAAATARGKHVGMGGIRDDELWKRFIDDGVRMVLTENDLTMLIQRATERAAFFKALQGR